MTKFVDFQTNFTSGEIDPLLKARTDIKQYQNGADKLTNVLVQPQGGVEYSIVCGGGERREAGAL